MFVREAEKNLSKKFFLRKENSLLYGVVDVGFYFTFSNNCSISYICNPFLLHLQMSRFIVYSYIIFNLHLRVYSSSHQLCNIVNIHLLMYRIIHDSCLFLDFLSQIFQVRKYLLLVSIEQFFLLSAVSTVGTRTPPNMDQLASSKEQKNLV